MDMVDNSESGPSSVHPAVSFRNGTIDLLRGAAAFGIVWFHAKAPFASIGLSGLTVFFLLGILLHRSGPQPAKKIIRSRADRLLRPWLIWSVVFAGLKFFQLAIEGGDVSDEFAPWMLLTGTSLHLWFLPFMWVCLTLLTIMEQHIRLSSLPVYLTLVAASLTSIPLTAPLVHQMTEHPFAEWVAAVPPVIIGIGLRAAGSSILRQSIILLIGLLSYAIGIGSTAPNIGPAIPIGLALTFLAIRTPKLATPLSEWIGQSAMSIYLIHPIFLSLSEKTQLALHPAYAALVAFLLSLALGETIRRAGLSRVLL